MKLFSAWFYSALNLISGLVILPLVLNNFNVEQINVWFLFFTVVSLSELVVFGFNITFSRFVSYTIAGIPFKKFQTIKDNSLTDETINVNHQLSQILTINTLIFILIACLYLVVILLVGHFALSKPISFLETPSNGWTAWYILVFGNFFRIITYVFPIFLQGMNKMSIYFNVQSAQKVTYLVVAFYVFYFSPSLINLSLAMTLAILVSSLLFAYYFFKYKGAIIFLKFNKFLFYVIWDSAWKSGITKIMAPIIQHISGVIFAQAASPVLSASYLLTLRVFNLLQQFSDITFDTFIPQIAMLRSQNKFDQLSKLIFKVCTLCYTIFVFGYLMFILFGSYLLDLIGSSTNFASPLVITLFSFAYYFNRLGGFQLNLSNQANNVIEHKALLIYSILYFGCLFIFIDDLNMWIFPFALIIAQLGTYIFTLPRSYKSYNTTFFQAEKFSFIPILIILIVINLFYLF
jgi:O-antigen/teichoic acid export membrane protein